MFVRSFYAGRLAGEPGVRPTTAGAYVGVEAGTIRHVATVPSADAADADVGGLHTLAMPALVDAHDHGTGLPGVACGAIDQPLELWLAATRIKPAIDPYLVSGLAFARLARSGVGSVVDCHIFGGPADRWVDEAARVCQAAKDIGIRLAFAVPMRDRGRLAYADDERFLSLLSPGDREALRAALLRPVLPIEEQLQLVDEIDARCGGPLVQIQYGPLGPQWCSDRLLARIAEESARRERRVHMHLLETRYQREWADAAHPGGLVKHLDEIGLLSPRLAVAHGVWLRPDEWELLAERAVIVVINTSSNLRLRSGIAPVKEMVRAGVPVAFGVDGLSLDDDEDALRELRLTYLLHAGTGLEEGIGKADLFTGWMRTGARTVSGRDDLGTLEGGRAADVLLLDYDALAADVMPGASDEMDVVVARASARFVETVIVDGRAVVHDSRVLGIDEKGIGAEVAARARASAPEVLALQPLIRRYQSALREFHTAKLHAAWAMPTAAEEAG